MKCPQSLMPLVRLIYRKYPGMIKAMEERHLMYNREKSYVRRREKEGSVLVLRPGAPLNINPVEKDPDELQRVYDLGRAAALEKLDDIRKFFES